MTKPLHYKIHPKTVRDKLLQATDLADELHKLEARLINLLKEIDKQKFYVRFGYKSLMGFCADGLKYTKTQSQRLATLIRKHQA